LNNPLDGVCLDNDAILAELLLHQDNLLRPFHNKVSSRIQRAFNHARQLGLGTSVQDTFVASQHDWKTTDVNIALDDVAASRVLDGDNDWRAVRYVAQSAFVRSDSFVDTSLFVPVGEPYVYVDIFEPKVRIYVRGDFVVGLDYIFDIDVDEIVE